MYRNRKHIKVQTEKIFCRTCKQLVARRDYPQTKGLPYNKIFCDTCRGQVEDFEYEYTLRANQAALDQLRPILREGMR